MRTNVIRPGYPVVKSLSCGSQFPASVAGLLLSCGSCRCSHARSMPIAATPCGARRRFTAFFTSAACMAGRPFMSCADKGRRRHQSLLIKTAAIATVNGFIPCGSDQEFGCRAAIMAAVFINRHLTISPLILGMLRP
jgi:hypothetical protein